MPSSLILQGGAAQTRTLVDDIVQNGHGFGLGDVIRWDNINTRYTKALADNATNAEVVGIVSRVDNSNNFQITYSGYVGIASLPDAPVLFLSSTTPGGLVGAPPSAVGTVVKPVLTKNTASGGGYIFTNYLGTQIGGSSTISVDEIQPVGTVMPFAGNTIPDTWLLCDGSSYALGDYAELYAKVLYSTGARAPMYGHVVQITLSAAVGGTVVGDFVILNNSATAPTPTAYDMIGRVVAVSGAVVTVQMLPRYDQPTKTFAFPNRVVESGNALRVYTTLDLTSMRSGTPTVASAVVTAFNTPDLRGRFTLGTNANALGEGEGDTTYNSAIGGYTMGAMGGEESHTLSMSEMASHSHDIGTISLGLSGSHRHYFVTDDNGGGRAEVRNYGVNQLASFGFGGAEGGGTLYLYETNEAGDHRHTISGSVAATGTNSPHNNMPPYLAVRYIIKAKPYTRAAIIEGIELPYDNLLVRNLRTRNVGGTNADLLFHVNVNGDSGNGTERMRLGNFLTIKPTASGTGLAGTGVYGGIHFEQSGGNDHSVGMTTTATHHTGTQGGILIQGSVNYGTKIHFLTTDNYDQGMKNRMTLDHTGRLGVGTASPTTLLDVNGLGAFNTVGVGTRAPASGVALDIVGAARSSIALTDYATANAKTLTTKEYVDTLGLGIGQTWQTFVIGTSANQRYSGTNYTNSSGKPIQIFVHTNVSSGITIKVGGVTIMSMNSGANLQFTNTFIVPNNTTYSVFTGTGSSNAPNQIYGWAELR